MNNQNPGLTLADRIDYKAMNTEKRPDTLERLKNEITDWQNPAFYQGFTQAERDRRIAGLKKLIATYEKPSGYDHDAFSSSAMR